MRGVYRAFTAFGLLAFAALFMGYQLGRMLALDDNRKAPKIGATEAGRLPAFAVESQEAGGYEVPAGIWLNPRSGTAASTP